MKGPTYISDLDTAFPRESSLTLKVSFDSGRHITVMTNMKLHEYRSLYLGRKIILAYLPRSTDEFTETATIVSITELA